MPSLANDATRYHSPQQLSRFISRPNLHRLRRLFFICTLVCLTSAAVDIVWFSGDFYFRWLGGTFIFFSLWIEQILLISYHNSFYFYGLNTILGLKGKEASGVTYEVAEAIFRNETDLTSAFCNHSLGKEILLRSGLSNEDIVTYLIQARVKLSAHTLTLPENEVFSFISLARHVVHNDSGFKSIMSHHALPDSLFIATAKWVTRRHHQLKQQERWWGRDVLSKTKSLGRDWSYGSTHILDQHTKNLFGGTVFSPVAPITTSVGSYVEEIESVLAQHKSGHVLLIGEVGVGLIDIVVALEKRLMNGNSLGAISGYQVRLIDTMSFFAHATNKQELERILISVFTEASKAGNVILLIESITKFISEAQGAGVFITELLDTFLASSSLRLIATDTPLNYHNFLKPLRGFTHHFTEIVVDASTHDNTLRILEATTWEHEARYHTLFTYPSLEAIVTGAERYLVEGVMPEKATSLQMEVAAHASTEAISLITNDLVFKIISEKTGVPVGPINTTERNLLLNLESELHRRVVGQDTAIQAVAGTMRRARAGVQSAKRPIGSFLFFGPTGVGKTETAKALASVFFGSENKMLRFNMSEFSDSSALSRLLGNATASSVLGDSLHDTPYAVLLLDEFEKAHRSIQDLFLQILDEGTFTDGRGNVINARNTIIIATSNAGSDLIMRTVQQRGSFSSLIGEIINYIIAQGIFRPELINRFDSTVIYEPLTATAQSEVATLFLHEFADRLLTQGYALIITPELIEVVKAAGYNPQFGARPMRRAVQDVIEEAVAKRIIAGTVTPGDTITLTKDELK